MKQFFILGRNPELSIEEIKSYLKARNTKYKQIFLDKNILTLDLQEPININELGGTIKSGTITFQGNEQELNNFLQGNEIIPSDKFSYATFGNLEPDILKQKFKQEKKKATLKHGRKKIRFQNKTSEKIPKADFELLLHKSKKVYLGIIEQKYNSKEAEKRDMNKPVRRESLAISPRLAKILINLSGAKPSNHLLDPFCGIGVILIEALLKNINVTGIDKDLKAIKGAKRNLEWAREIYKINKKYNLIHTDSKNTKNEEFDAIATETPLGTLLKKRPNDNLAKSIIEKFERTIIPVLKRLKEVKKQQAKIAITFPKIKTHSTNLEKIKSETNLKIIAGPIEESHSDQHISREILVFE